MYVEIQLLSSNNESHSPLKQYNTADNSNFINNEKTIRWPIKK